MSNGTTSSRRREGREAFEPLKDLGSSNPYMDLGKWQDFADGWNAAAREYSLTYPDYFKEKFRNIKIKIYRDTYGCPTCAKNFKTGEFCVFLRTKRFGTLDVCSVAPITSQGSDKLNRRLDQKQQEMGSLIPAPWCPLWNENLENNGEGNGKKNKNL